MRRTKKKIKNLGTKKSKAYKRRLHSVRPSLFTKAGMITDRSSPPTGIPVLMGTPVDPTYERQIVYPPAHGTGMAVVPGMLVPTSSQVPHNAPAGFNPSLLPSHSGSNTTEYRDALDPIELHAQRIMTGVNLDEAIHNYADRIISEVMNARTAKDRAIILKATSTVYALLAEKFNTLDTQVWTDDTPRRQHTSNYRARREALAQERARARKAMEAASIIKLWAIKQTGITARTSRYLRKNLTRATQRIINVGR